MYTTMNQSWSRVLKMIKHHTFQSFIFVSLAGFLIYKVFSVSPVTVETIEVQNGSLKQYVKVSGSVSASKDASLAFQTQGEVAYVGVKVGDAVSSGKVLATLQTGDQQASLLQAKANLENTEAVLGQLTQGSRKEEIAIKQQALDNANASLEQLYTSIPDVIQNVDGTTADIVKNKLATMFSFVGDRYILSFTSCDQSLQSKIEQSRSQLDVTLASFQKKSGTVTTFSQKSDVDAVFEQAYKTTVSTNELINNISDLLLTSCSLSNPSLDSLRTTLSTVHITITTLFADITAKRSALTSSKNLILQTSRDLDLTKAGTDPYKIKAQNAAVSQAKAQVAQAESNLRKTIITAPFSGTISDVLISEGEAVTSGKSVIGMLAVDAFEVEAKIPEADIVKVSVGRDADVTLDAYGKGVVFPAKVTRINPTATLEGGVPMYKVLVTFSEHDSRIKSGMTANVNIVTETKESIIAIPARFVKIIDAAHGTVVLQKGKQKETVNLLLGSRGDAGLIEIKDGLNIGDIVLAPTTDVKASQKQTQ